MSSGDRRILFWILLAACQVGLLVYNAIAVRTPWLIAMGAGTLALAVGMAWFWGRKRR